MSFCRFLETMGITYSVKQFMRLAYRSWSCFLFCHLGCAPNGLLGKGTRSSLIYTHDGGL